MKNMALSDTSFLLSSPAARRLYHEYAASHPLLDFHCHLEPAVIAANQPFRDPHHLWLAGDHYKWRAMRAQGVEERLCTGDAPAYEKFLAWAATVPRTLRNPLYHWTHLELERYFGISTVLNPETAPAIWAAMMEQLPELKPRDILQKFKVRVVSPVEDPANPLDIYLELARSGLSTAVYPSFRPDGLLRLDRVEEWNAWLDRLAAVARIEIRTLADALEAVSRRHQAFHEAGCRSSDHGIVLCPTEFAGENEAARGFSELRAGRALDPEKARRLNGFLMLYLARLDAEKGWAKFLHLGALRDINTAMFARLGRDTGFDAIDDQPQARPLAAFLGRLTEENALPRMVLFNLNPADNYIFAAVAGCFQDAVAPSKLQHGPAWWFLDQREGIEWQINALSSLGLLAHFIGMTTDSRSFMSYPRHEYFRRVLCNLLGREMESGELPMDWDLVGGLVSDICYANAERYFRFPA